MKEKPWYKDGLDFSCQKCGKCCWGFPGVVWINEKDIKNISNFLKISEREFIKKYVRKIKNRLSLKENPYPSYECIFFQIKNVLFIQ